MAIDLGSQRFDRARRAFALLHKHVTSQTPVTIEMMCEETGWEKRTVTSYMTKKWKPWLEKDTSGYTVVRQFAGITEEYFLRHHSQNSRPADQFKRASYGMFAAFEFLLPLTKEAELRRTLDSLFYRDTVERRLRNIEPDELAAHFAGDDVISRAIEFVGSHFGGYSLSHVSGRFRADSLLPRDVAASRIADNGQYLVDETTAVVRFIVPIQASRSEGFASDVRLAPDQSPYAEALSELQAVRFLFLSLFAEAVVESVQGEEEIWMIETAPDRRLFVWERASS